jgi:diguanylate cyclase (GGDEF)-like protein
VIALFVLCALLPVALTIFLSYGRVYEALLQERTSLLRGTAGLYGNHYVSRLTVAERFARAVTDDLDGGQRLQEGLRVYFRTIAVTRPSGTRYIIGGRTTLPEIGNDSITLARLASGSTVLAVSDAEPSGVGSSPRSVWLVQYAKPASGAAESVAFEIDRQYLWGATDELPSLTDLCVLDGSSRPIQCSHPLPDDVLARLQQQRPEMPKGELNWTAESTAYLSGYLELFLRGSFGADSWLIVVTQPEDQALEPVGVIPSLVVPVVVLGLLVAALLGMVQVRRIMIPLKELIAATKRVAERDFGTRLTESRTDEFGALARAFNSMSHRVGLQFDALGAMAEIDAVILSDADVARVIAILLRRISELTKVEECFVLVAESLPGVYRIHARDGTRKNLPSSLELTQEEVKRLLAAPRGLRLPHPDQLALPAVENLGYKSVFVLPISLAQELTGAIALGYSTDTGPEEEELSILRDFGDRVAVALATARRDQELHRRAYYDSLTQIPNRMLGVDELRREMSAASRQNKPLAVLFVDLDGFSQVNDTLGHAAGDQLLVRTAQRLRGCVRTSDIVARLGGDEFAVVLGDIRQASDAAVAARNIIETLSGLFETEYSSVFVSASIGIAVFPADGATAEELLQNADLAMYRAKQSGRGQAVFFEPSMNAEVHKRLQMERELRAALERNEFVLHYQPQLSLKNNQILGAEALLRWKHPDHGLSSPGLFIGFAESRGLIDAIGRWVLDTACEQLVAWNSAGVPINCVSVNVSPVQFRKPGFAETVRERLRISGLTPRSLHLEITESAVIDNEGASGANLTALLELGTPLELDDFGTGYSSLAYLQRLPVETVKLDRSLIDAIDRSSSSEAIVKAAVAMVHALGKSLLAEGVERPEQIDLLRRWGCDAVQGHHFSHPLSADELERFVRGHVARRKVSSSTFEPV